ncbi:hypothetical protein JZ751_016091 [Albula glossodonta]|uniref:Uncharacterized protein n=1 Tax=Albula glossodonta TaxID=121402 RepID=A0A8T2NRA0_9TELE|nr:hypothetical protein JZ751_016091 [Albula glossodonta]
MVADCSRPDSLKGLNPCIRHGNPLHQHGFAPGFPFKEPGPPMRAQEQWRRDSRILPEGALLGTLPYEIKIVIAGNHELTFDQEFMADLIKQDFYYFPSASKLKPENYENVQSLLTNCIYLQDSEVTVRGLRIYGSPW